MNNLPADENLNRMTFKASADSVESVSPRVVESMDEKQHIQDADDALKFATESEGISWTEQEEKRVVRKIDAVILSLVRLTPVLLSYSSYALSLSLSFLALIY